MVKLDQYKPRDQGRHSPHNRPKDKDRICLSCNQLFPSAGPGNRICPNCTYEQVSFVKQPHQTLPTRRTKGLNNDAT